jgi:4-amino-4-deoxy-L-arabinose transferase-like glycosyltransferase
MRLAGLDRPPATILAVFIAAQLVLWSLLPSLVQPNAPLDVIEGLTWGRDLQLGYYKHPPLQAVLLDGTELLLGKSSFGFFFLSQLAVALAYVLIWKLAREFVDPGRALLAVMLESGIVYFSFASVEFNPNVLQLPLWAGTILYVWRGIERGRLLDWLLAGFFAALAMSAKYSSGMLLAALALFIVATPTARARLGTRSFWLGVGLLAVLLLPNFSWLVLHDFQPLHYATARAGRSDLAPVKFLGAQLLDHAGFFILLLLAAYPGLYRRAKAKETGVTLRGRAFLLTAGLGPLALSLVASDTVGLGLRDMWGAPMFDLSGLIAVVFLVPRRPAFTLRPFVAGAFALLLLASSGFAIVGLLSPLFASKVPRGVFPGPAVAEQLTQLWRERTGRPLGFVIGSTWIGGNVAFYSSDRPLVLIDGDFSLAPWVDRAALAREGALLVWPADPRTGTEAAISPPPGLQPNGAQGMLTVPARSVLGKPQISVGWQILTGAP